MNLIEAMEARDIKKIEALIAEGVDLNIQDELGNSVLHWAAGNIGLEDILEMLIRLGADVNVKNKEGFTPLHRAVLGQNSKIIKMLIKAGADINATSANGLNTPLSLAILNRKRAPLITIAFEYRKIEKLLIKAGAKE